jgi:hypothetical protein
LTALWNDLGELDASKLRDLQEADIRSLLQLGRVQFVVADVGNKLEWIPSEDCFHFWKTIVKPHMCSTEGTPLESFPDEYAFFASEWTSKDAVPIVVLEKSH